jgi:hypothetical protein
VAVFVGV